ncbi:hypothetical protein [Fulvivirga kasyanovii]|uniref:DUF4143 domain-containing protein n=1 Tax=Fulvivirga kasyanovii TaxID=396812 RepID=A0ABW9RKW2_9BACT|nr:hypothetical protein [Fulvivirga kasyanovii]MTI24714.1 hypothetical protein [Fulvivirga kasyanovii]
MIVKLSSDNSLRRSDIDYLGGHFNWFSRMGLKGTGSTRFIYLDGISEFDDMKTLSQDLNTVSFELLRGGLVLRFSKKNIQKALLIRYTDILSLTVVSQRIRKYWKGRERIVKKADITIVFGDKELVLGLSPSYYKSGIDFLSKRPIKQYCTHRLNPEIIEDKNFTGWLNWLDELL